jgi:hypothetical protein
MPPKEQRCPVLVARRPGLLDFGRTAGQQYPVKRGILPGNSQNTRSSQSNLDNFPDFGVQSCHPSAPPVGCLITTKHGAQARGRKPGLGDNQARKPGSGLFSPGRVVQRVSCNRHDSSYRSEHWPSYASYRGGLPYHFLRKQIQCRLAQDGAMLSRPVGANSPAPLNKGTAKACHLMPPHATTCHPGRMWIYKP